MQSNNENLKNMNESEIVDLTQTTKTTTTIKDNVETIKTTDHVETDPSPAQVVAISDAEEESTTNETQTGKKTKKRFSVSLDGTKLNRFQLSDIKRRKIKVAGAPKMPLNGYVRYMNARRESLRKEQPDKSAIEHTRIIGEEWHQLSSENKAPYMEAAEQDKQRYNNELTEFLEANPEVLANELAKIKNAKNAVHESPNLPNTPKEKGANNNKNKTTPVVAMVPPNNNKLDTNKTNSPPASNNFSVTTHEQEQNIEACIPAFQINPPPGNCHNNENNNLGNNLNNNNNTNNNVTITQGEIPIFTNEFLEHNKAFDMELRTLRKSKTDLEVQNAVLEKHVDNMKSGVKKLSDENSNLNQRNRLLKLYLITMRQKLAKAFGDLALPSEPNGANMENIDKYMSDLAIMTTSNTHGPASLNKAKDILRKLDLQIQL